MDNLEAQPCHHHLQVQCLPKEPLCVACREDICTQVINEIGKEEEFPATRMIEAILDSTVQIVI